MPILAVYHFMIESTWGQGHWVWHKFGWTRCLWSRIDDLYQDLRESFLANKKYPYHKITEVGVQWALDLAYGNQACATRTYLAVDSGFHFESLPKNTKKQTFAINPL